MPLIDLLRAIFARLPPWKHPVSWAWAVFFLGIAVRPKESRRKRAWVILRRTLHPILENFNEPKCGCHAFRRFRITHLRKNGVPEELIHFWAGHVGKSVTDDYSKG